MMSFVPGSGLVVNCTRVGDPLERSSAKKLMIISVHRLLLTTYLPPKLENARVRVDKIDGRYGARLINCTNPYIGGRPKRLIDLSMGLRTQ